MRQFIFIVLILFTAQLSAAIKVTFPTLSQMAGNHILVKRWSLPTHSMSVATTMTRSYSPPSDFMSQKSMPLD